MNYIDKEKSIKADIAGIENRVRHAFNQGYDFGFKEGKKKAKSQESVLDKIRAEIKKAVWEDVVVSLDGTDETRISCLDPDDVFKIIDKYRESEDAV